MEAAEQMEIFPGADSSSTAGADSRQELAAQLSWREALANERQQPYFQEILKFVENERSSGKSVFPPNSEVFAALQFTPLEAVKVVIIGQDPYHGPGQAHGLAFSVKPGVPLPPSLRNIYKELNSDLGISMPAHGCLTGWAKEGVLLLNTSLTVEQGRPGSHSKIGWERFTDRIIEILNERTKSNVFMLWGAHAQRKGAIIDRKKHLVLAAAHPSPLSAHNGFMGCRHFSAANSYLQQQGKRPVSWDLGS